MSTSEGTVDVQSGIDNYDFLKFINANFADSVGHYINMWFPYHQMFAMIAANLVAVGGLAWVAVLALKSPVDKFRTAAGGLAMVLFTTMMLSASSFTIPGAGASLQLANGAGWTVKIIGNVYQLFKASLDKIKDKQAIEAAFANAYHITDQNTIKRFIDSPMAPMYQDYIEKCQPAFEAAAGNNANAVAAGRYVGLYGSGGIGQDEVTIEKANGFLDHMKGVDPNTDKVVQASILTRDGGSTVKEGVQKGLEILKSIPADKNPFDGKTVPVAGYQIPTQAYWENEMYKKKPTGDVFYDVTQTPDSYLNAAYVDGATGSQVDKTRAYPKNCADLYKMVDMGQRAWTAAVKGGMNVGLATATARDGRDASMMLYRDTAQRLKQQGNLNGTPLEAAAGYAGAKFWDHGAGGNVSGLVIDSTFTELQDVGRWFQEVMIKYKIPMMITCCAMLAGFLVVMFPVICIMSVFISPKMLITFVKLMVFSFLVPFTNDACLTMASTLLAVNKELIEGYNAGNFVQNDPAVISAATAQYVIFIAITVVEVIFAKMLIWDDVKGLGSFNPGAVATSTAATGGALIAGAMKLGGGLMKVGAAAGTVAKGGTQAVSSVNQKMKAISGIQGGGSTGGGGGGGGGGPSGGNGNPAGAARSSGATAPANPRSFLSSKPPASTGNSNGIQKPDLTPKRP